MTVEARAKSGSIVGLIALALNLLQSVFLVPLLLTFWSAEVYGLWMGVAAAVALLVSLDSGHQNYLGNVFNRLWIEDRRLMAETVRSGMRAAVAIACVELTVGCLIAASGSLSRFAGIKAAGAGMSGALILNLVFWVLNGSIGGILVRIYTPAGLYTWAQWLGIVSRLLGFLAVAGAVAGGASLLGAMAAQVVAWSIFNVYIFADLRRRFPDVHPWWSGGNWGLAWRNFRSSLLLTINGFVEQGGSNGLVLVVGHALNPLSVAIFTTLRTVANLALQGASIMLNPLAPDLVRYHLERDGDKLTAVFRVSWVIGTTLVTAGLVTGVLLLEPLYHLWTRGRLPLEPLLFAFLGVAVAIRQWAAPLQSYLASINQLHSQTVMACVRAGFGLGLAALLLSRMGVAAAGLGALAAELAAALTAVVAVRSQLRGFMTKFPWRPALLALAQITVAELVWLLLAARLSDMPLYVITGIVVIALLAWRQWTGLPVDVRKRLTARSRR